jgi:ABC-type transporter MlaC component
MGRILLATLALVFVLGAPARAQQDADQQAIIAVIQGQLQAFQADDAAGAYQYAAPSIQAMFPSPDVFMNMVRTAYQPVYRPQRVDFLDLTTIEGRLTQRVALVGPDGVPVVARYYMRQMPDGAWRITGVTLHEQENTGV